MFSRGSCRNMALWILVLSLLAGSAAAGTNPPKSDSKKSQPRRGKTPPESPGKGVKPRSRIGKVRIFRKESRVEVDGVMCLEEGQAILDFLAIRDGSGKEYESLIKIDCRAAALHAGLLAIGARSGDVPKAVKGPRVAQTKRINPPNRVGDRIRISVRWKEGGQETSAPVETWLIDRSTGGPSGPLTWIFTGSFFTRLPQSERVVYAADVEKVVVSLWYDEVCVLNLAKDAGSPYRGEKLGFEINRAAAPPLGTKIKVSFHFERPAPAGKPKGAPPGGGKPIKAK